jgi:hypothetical protein
MFRRNVSYLLSQQSLLSHLSLTFFSEGTLGDNILHDQLLNVSGLLAKGRLPDIYPPISHLFLKSLKFPSPVEFDRTTDKIIAIEKN